MKLISKNYEEGTVVVEMSRLEAAALAAVYGEKSDSETISLVQQDYGEDVARRLGDIPEVDGETATFLLYDVLDDIARGDA